MKIIIDYRYIQGSGKEGFFRGEVKKKVETVRFENTKYGFLLYGEEDGVWKVEEGREIFTFLSFKSYLGEGEDLQFAMHGGGWSVIIVGLDGRYGGREKLEKDEDLS